MSDRETLVRDVFRMLPASKRADLKKAAEMGGLSIGAAMAFSLAQQPIRDYCPPEERALVGGLLMRAFIGDAKP